MVPPSLREAEVIASHLDFARVVIGEVAERLTSREAVPTVKDGLAAFRLLAESSPENEIDYDGVKWAFIEFFMAVSEETDYDQFQCIGRRIEDSPTIRRLRAEDSL